MATTTLLIFAIAFFAYSLVAKRLSSTLITGPMLFLGFGFLLSPSGFSLIDVGVQNEGLHLLVELTLVLVLFADAATITVTALNHDKTLPFSMLGVGLPLAVASGTGIAIFLFPELCLWEAALLAAILTPTDAALGSAIVSHRAVPERFKRAITVESGLNDGLMLPLVLLFATLASMSSHHDKSVFDWGIFLLLQLGVGPLAGLAQSSRLKPAHWIGWATAARVLPRWRSHWRPIP